MNISGMKILSAALDVAVPCSVEVAEVVILAVMVLMVTELIFVVLVVVVLPIVHPPAEQTIGALVRGNALSVPSRVGVPAGIG